MEDGGRLALLDRVEDRAIPDIDAVLEADSQDDQHAEADGVEPRQSVAVAAPEAARADPEAGEEIVLAGLLGLFGRQLRVGLDQLGRRRRHFLAGLADDFDYGRLLARFALSGRLLHGRITRAKSKGSREFPRPNYSAAPSRTRRRRASRCSTRDS